MAFLKRWVHAPWVLLYSLLSFNGVHSAPLQGSEWKPVMIGETVVPEAASAFVRFGGKGRLQGYSGCNRLFAEYKVDEGHVFIGPVAATRMACSADVMMREAALVTALENARTYQRARIRLVLFDMDGIPILELRQTDWD
jgi:heat shock protein HslJ